jgi:hypothetical protein
MPEDLVVHVNGLPMSGHTVDLTLSVDGVLVRREDQLSSPLYIQEHADGKPRALPVGARMTLQPVPVYFTLRENGQVSVSLQEEAHAFPGGPHSKIVWSSSLVVFLALLIGGFHFIIIRMVYMEYCRK